MSVQVTVDIEARADELAEKLKAVFRELADFVEEAVQEAVECAAAAEREACAKLVEEGRSCNNFDHRFQLDDCWKVAAAIRARGNP